MVFEVFGKKQHQFEVLPIIGQEIVDKNPLILIMYPRDTPSACIVCGNDRNLCKGHDRNGNLPPLRKADRPDPTPDRFKHDRNEGGSGTPESKSAN